MDSRELSKELKSKMSFMDEDRELMTHGVATGSLRKSANPILSGYMPAAPVHRYSLKKWSKDDWKNNVDAKTFQASRDIQLARSVGDEAKELMSSVRAIAESTQTEATSRLAERISDVSKWKFELEKAILDITAEMDNLSSEMRRVELALQAVNRPMSIASECLANRQRRMDSDLVQDDAEVALLRELEVATSIRSTLRSLLDEALHQQSMNGAAKKLLEDDWSDKTSAHHLDSRSAALKNSRGNTMHKLGVALFNESEVAPAQWLESSDQRVREASNEREQSVRLRSRIASILSESTLQLRAEADRVEASLATRVSETELAMRNLELELKETVMETNSMEKVIEELKESLWEKQKFARVAQTRLANRRERPNLELCRDEAALTLVDEVRQLERDVQRLQDKLDEAEERRVELLRTRLALEKEMEVKRNSILIDRERCLKARNEFPDSNTLSGYSNQNPLFSN